MIQFYLKALGPHQIKNLEFCKSITLMKDPWKIVSVEVKKKKEVTPKRRRIKNWRKGTIKKREAKPSQTWCHNWNHKPRNVKANQKEKKNKNRTKKWSPIENILKMNLLDMKTPR